MPVSSYTYSDPVCTLFSRTQVSHPDFGFAVKRKSFLWGYRGAPSATTTRPNSSSSTQYEGMEQQQTKHRFAPLNAPPRRMPKRFGWKLQQNYHRPHALSSAIFQGSPVITPFVTLPKKTPACKLLTPHDAKTFWDFC
jgi:hypothetical protein